MRKDVRKFTESCIHCIALRTGEHIPRPEESSFHRLNPREYVHADFLYVGTWAECELNYMLVIRDDLSSYTWLHACKNVDNDAVTHVLSTWCSCSGCMEWLLTYQGSPFVASLMRFLTKESRIRHHLTIPYCPRSTGTVERLCKEVLRITNSLLSEWKLSVIQLPLLIKAIQKFINHSPPEKLCKNKEGSMLSPMGEFTKPKAAHLLIKRIPTLKLRNSEALDE